MPSKAAPSMICEKYYLWYSTTSKNILDTAQYTVLQITAFQYTIKFDRHFTWYTYAIKSGSINDMRKILPLIFGIQMSSKAAPSMICEKYYLWYSTTGKNILDTGQYTVLQITAF